MDDEEILRSVLVDHSYEKLAEALHEMYLEACEKLGPENFNPDTQKSWSDLTEEQKAMDRAIAWKVGLLMLKVRSGVQG